VCLLAPIALLNYLDRQMLAAMKSSVMTDIPDIGSEANWGRMLGQFKWVYAFLSPVGGWIADRFGRRITICGSLFAWSAVTWWTGHVHSYGELLTARSLMGISEAFYIPAALALIADYHTGETRSRAISFHQMGIYCGVILGGFTGYAAEMPGLGWRGAFGWSGVVGMALAVPMLFFLKDRPRHEAARSDSAAGLGSVRALLTNRSFLLLVLYFTLPALAGWVVRDWMPAILKSEFKIGQGKAGVSATLYWQSAAIVGAFVGGWLAEPQLGLITLETAFLGCAQPALRADVLPDLGIRFDREITQRTILGVATPLFDPTQLRRFRRGEERITLLHGLAKATGAQVIRAPLQHRKTKVHREHLLQNRQVFFHQLLLQINRVGGDHRLLLLPDGEKNGRNQVRKTFTDTSTGFYE
jgi:MFS family permease